MRNASEVLADDDRLAQACDQHPKRMEAMHAGKISSATVSIEARASRNLRSRCATWCKRECVREVGEQSGGHAAARAAP